MLKKKKKQSGKTICSKKKLTIMDTQPKDSGGGGGKSRDEMVKDLALDYLSKTPPDFVEEVCFLHFFLFNKI